MNRRTLFKSFTGIVAASALQCFGFKTKLTEVKKTYRKAFSTLLEKGVLPHGLGYSYQKVNYTRTIPTGSTFDDIP